MFGAIAILLILGVVAVGGLHHSVSSTEAYRQAIIVAQSNLEARRVLGDNIKAQIPAIGFTNSVNGERFTEFSVPLIGSRGRGHLYAVANAVNGVWEFSRLWLYIGGGGEKFDLTPVPALLNLPSVPVKKIFLVPIDLEPQLSLNWAPAYYKAKFGIDVEVLPDMFISKDWEDRPDNQVPGSELLERLTGSHPEVVKDPTNTLIAVTSRDIGSHMYGRTFTENIRHDARFGLVSCARFRTVPFLARWNPEWMNSRLQKMLTKNIAILYFNLPMSSDYSSMLSGGVLSGTEVDLMSGSIIGTEGQWDPFIDSGEIGVTTYTVPGKPSVWRMEPSSEIVADTSVRVFSANLTLGLFSYGKTDFVFEGDYPLHFTRVYRTQDPQSRPFGVGANDSMDIFLTGQMGMYIDLILEDGGRVHFRHARPVVGQRGDAYIAETCSGNPFCGSRAIFGKGNVWTLERPDGWKFFFPYKPNAPGPNVTILTGFTDPAGHKYEMVRNESGDLLSVTTPSGQWLHFEGDPEHRIRTISDSSGRIVRYEYDASGLLSHVADSEGTEERYTYDDKAEMISIAVNSRVPIFTNTYSIAGNIMSQTLPDGGKFEYHYTNDPNGRGNVLVPDLITAPNGLVTSIEYDSDGFRQWLPHPPVGARNVRISKK